MANAKKASSKNKTTDKGAKTPAKKAAPKKKTTKKATPKKQPAPEQAALFQKKTIAERTVAWKTGIYFNILRWLAIIPFLLLIVFFTFFMAGYSFTVLVCWCIIGIILFYNCMHLLQKKYPRDARILRRIFTVILCIGLLVCGVTEAIIIKASFGSPEEDVDYLVVLGAKVNANGPSVSLYDRICAAYEYLEAHPDTVAVLSGGMGTDEPITEAECMYRELVELGIAPSRLWKEDKATSTWENLNFSLNLIEEKTGQRPSKLGVLSSEYHLFRASLFTKAVGAEFVGIPAHTSRPSQMINHFMREVAGVWHYWILGGNYHA